MVPLFMDSLRINPSVLGVATSASAFGAMLVRPASGMLADRKSKKFVMILGLSIMMMGMLGFIVAPFAIAIVIIRITQGMGFSAKTTAQMAIATDVLPKSKVNKGLSYFGICMTLSGSFASMIGMALLSGDNFTPTWLGGAGVFAVSLIIVSTLNYEKTFKKKHTSFQADSAKPSLGHLHTDNIKQGWFWTYFERKAFLPSLIQVMVIASSSVIVFLPSYSVQIGTNIPVFYTLQAVSMLLMNIVVGNLIDRVRNPLVLFVPSAVSFSLSLLLTSLATGNAMFYFAAILYGIGFGACNSIMSVVIMSTATPDRRGAASATFQCAGDIGMGVGSLVGGVIAGLLGYRAFFAVLAVLPVIAIVMSILILGQRKEKSV
jgi:MFS family permease